MPITHPVTYEESGINLSSILLIQGARTRASDNPVQIDDNILLPQRPIRVSAGSEEIRIWVREELICHITKNPDETLRQWHSRIDHLRHDYVGSMLQDTTDDSLRVLGIDSNLTPDKISLEKRMALELATTVSLRREKTEQDYKKKLLNYKDITDLHHVRLTVLCVSSSHVFTNCYMRANFVPELCRRLREAASFELEISNQTGRMPNQSGDDGDEDVKKVEDIFNLMSGITKKVSWDFNEELEDLSLSKTSDGEMKEASSIMGKSWKEASKLLKRKPNSALDDYLKSLRIKETRKDHKRIMPFPCFLPKFTNESASLDDYAFFSENIKMSESEYSLAHLIRLGIQSSSHEQKKFPPTSHFMQSLSEAMNSDIIPESHVLRRHFEFEETLTEQEKDTIALSGPGSKLRREMEEVINHEVHQKRSFDMDSPIEDIEEFMNNDELLEHDDILRRKSDIYNIIDHSQKKANKYFVSKKLNDWSLDLGINRYSHFISDVCLELSYEYKHPHKDGRWTCKPMRNYDCLILLKSTGSHTFFSLVTRKENAQIWDLGRLGPSLTTTGAYIFSDFCSVVEATLEHFIKAGPYMTSLTGYLMQHFKIPFMTKQVIIPMEMWKTLKGLFLIYFNNKVDLENLILDCRFLYMKVLQKFENDPYIFIDRLPSVLRSRLTVYFLRKVIALMRKYRTVKPKQHKIHGLPESDPNSVRITGLRCIFHDAPLQLDQLVDTFYFSYTISKMKGRVGDRSLKIVTKIVKEEMWARDNIAEVKSCLWGNQESAQRQFWSSSLLKVMIDLLKSKWRILHGDNFIGLLNRRIAQDFSRQKFSDIATLKASSKNHENPQINLPRNDETSLTGKEYVKVLKELNPKLQGKRPRVITSLVLIIKRYMNETGDKNPTLLSILPFCIKKLVERGYIYSDCFPKDQHGGDREIHVAEIMARIVQYFIERSAKCMDYMFKSDTVLNPKRKESFMKDHELYAQTTLGNHMTMCKSADASKWCQRHHVSKFYFAMNRLTEGHWNPLFYHGFYLWTVKRIAIPDELVSMLASSSFPNSDNETLLWLQDRFIKGQTPFVCESSNTIETKFGMWQGFYHRVSSIIHSICQEFYADVVRSKCNEKKFPVTVSVVQGSDDSACCISFNRKGRPAEAFVHILLKWKEEFQKYISIWPSEAKSSIGTQLFVEYNSEWWYRGKILKPTFRWVSACLETSIVETFYERMQLFYNGLTTAVEMGTSTLCASVIQKSQAWLHYLMMGFSNHILRSHVAGLLLSCPHPSLGFFPLDGEEYCGVTGFDYSLFVIHKEWKIPVADLNKEMVHPSMLLDYDSKVDKSVRSDLKRVFVGFGNRRLWEQMIEEIDLGVLEDALEAISKKPLLLYKEDDSWEEQRIHMIMKLFQKGVRSSVSSYQPTIRSAVSSAYLFNRPCVWTSLRPEAGREKVSLVKALLDSSSLLTPPSSPEFMKTSDEDQVGSLPLFVNESEYGDFYSYIEDMRRGFSFQEVPYGRHSRVTVPVWGEIFMNETPLIDICKRALFDLNSIPISKTSFKLLWAECKAKYRFLRDTYEETIKSSGLDHVQLFDFLTSASGKTRKVTLQDTSAKNPHLTNSLSRIYWPQIKVRSKAQTLDENFSNVRHLLMCTMSFFFSKKQKMRVTKKIMDKSGLKALPLARCPPRSRKLKVLCNFMMNQDKERALLEIPQVKQGVLGFFIKPQGKMRNGNRGFRYEGRGTWLGSVCGILVRIDLKDEHVEKITIKCMQDTISLSKRLSTLIAELKQTFPTLPRRSESLYYLNPKGHFLVSPSPVMDCICVEVDPTLDPPDYETLVSKEWGVEIENTTLRMFYVENLTDEKSRKVTLISDTLTSRDWSPEMTPKDLSWTGSKTFNNYCRGDPVSIYDLIEDLKIDVNSSYTENVLSRMSSSELEVGIFSLTSLKNNLRSYILSHIASGSQRRLDLEREMKLRLEGRYEQEVTNEEVEAFLKFGEGNAEVDLTMKDWAEEVNEQSSHISPEHGFLHEADIDLRKEGMAESDDDMLDEVEWSNANKVMEEMAELFFELDMDDAGISSSDFELIRQMPLDNQFWLDIILMTKTETRGTHILDCICSNSKPDNEDFLISHAAFFMSLVTGENLYSKTRKESSSDIEHSINMSTRDPIVAKEDVEDHISKLNERLSDLNNAIASSQGYVREILLKRQAELQVQLEAYQSNQAEIYHEDIGYYEFMDNLLRKLKEKNIYDKSEQSADLEVLTTLLISDVLESAISKNRMKLISDSDLSAMRSRIWDRIFSGSLVRFIANSFNLSISIAKDGKSIFEHYPKLALESIELKF